MLSINLTQFISKKPRILLLGDFFLDRYLIGSPARLSPEAPVPVLLVQEQLSKPGGAGNVALNLKALGADVVCFGAVGADSYGTILLDALKSSGIELCGMLINDDIQTIVKERIIASGQQMVRLDREKTYHHLFQEGLQPAYQDLLEKAISESDLITISDYQKGFCSAPLLDICKTLASQYDKKIVVDPKGRDFTKYRGAYLIKPNYQEAREAYRFHYPKYPLKEDDFSSLREFAKHLVVTNGSEGALLFSSELYPTNFSSCQTNFSSFLGICISKKISGYPQEVKDVTGAGDTFLAALSIGISAALSEEESVSLANIASSLAVRRLGCAVIQRQEWLEEICKRLYPAMLDPHDFFVLEQLQKHRLAEFFLKTPCCMSEDLLKLLQKAKAEQRTTLLRISPDLEPQASFLSRIPEVDYVMIERIACNNNFKKDKETIN